MLKTKDITIRFSFTKSDGNPIEILKYSEEEFGDIRKCLALELTDCPWGQPGAKIISVQFIYDGITPVQGEIEGYFFNRKYEYPLDGYPTPVVRFHLDRAMDEKDFLNYINESSYCVLTKLMDQDEEDPYFAEDHNGYTSVISSEVREQTILFLQFNEVYSGKTFRFPDGLPEGGHLIPALEFVLKPTGK